jgi:prefoldin subunit 5
MAGRDMDIDENQRNFQRLAKQYNQLKERLENYEAILNNQNKMKMFLEDYMPDIQAVETRIRNLQELPDLAPTQEQIQTLRRAVDRLENFLNTFLQQKPTYAYYLVDATFWMYLPMTYECLKAVIPDLEKDFFGEASKRRNIEQLKKRYDAIRQFAPTYLKVVFYEFSNLLS